MIWGIRKHDVVGLNEWASIGRKGFADECGGTGGCEYVF